MIFRKQQNPHGRKVGIFLAADGIAMAQVDASGGGAPSIRACAAVDSQQPEEQYNRLESFIKQHALKGCPCHVVLEDSFYELLQMPAPPVADDELTSALRWSVKDLIEYPVEDAVLDVFRVPVQGNREKKVYVVASPRESLQSVVDLVGKSGLKLESIGIGELSLGSLIEKLEGQEKGIAVLHFESGHGTINLYQDSALYLSRKIDTGIEQIETRMHADGDPAATEQLYESIILELQRSLDFYESEFAKPPISRLVVVPRHPVLQSFCDYAASRSGLMIDFLNLAQLFPESTGINDETETDCLLAVAAVSGEREAVA